MEIGPKERILLIDGFRPSPTGLSLSSRQHDFNPWTDRHRYLAVDLDVFAATQGRGSMKDLETAIQDDLIRQKKNASDVTSLILDGKCKCTSLKALAPLTNLQVLSLANTKLPNLEDLPALPKLTHLTLSDNPQLSGGLKHLVTATPLLSKLSLAASRISRISELEHLAGLPHLKCLDLLDCPVQANLGDAYRSKVLKMLEKVEWLDNMDRNGVERDASDDEEEEEFDEEGGEEEGDEGGGAEAAAPEGGGDDEGDADDGDEGEEDEANPEGAAVGDDALPEDEEEYEEEEDEEGEDDDEEDDEVRCNQRRCKEVAEGGAEEPAAKRPRTQPAAAEDEEDAEDEDDDEEGEE